MSIYLNDSYLDEAKRKLVANPPSVIDEAKIILWQEEQDLETLEWLVGRYVLFVYKVAKHYDDLYSLPFDDLFQQGMLGLLKAFRYYIPDKKTRFLTYAMWRIREALTISIRSEIKERKAMKAVNMIDSIEEDIEEEMIRRDALDKIAENFTQQQYAVYIMLLAEIPQNRIAKALGVGEPRITQLKKEIFSKIQKNSEFF